MAETSPPIWAALDGAAAVRNPSTISPLLRRFHALDLPPSLPDLSSFLNCVLSPHSLHPVLPCCSVSTTFVRASVIRSRARVLGKKKVEHLLPAAHWLFFCTMKVSTTAAAAAIAGVANAANTCPCGPGGGPITETVTVTVTAYPSSSSAGPVGSGSGLPYPYPSGSGKHAPLPFCVSSTPHYEDESSRRLAIYMSNRSRTDADVDRSFY